MHLTGPARRAAVETLRAIQATVAHAPPVGKTRQLATAMLGFAAMIVIPVVAMYWARKRWRP